MRTAIYVRVSTTEQAESGYSIDEQIEKLESYAKIRDWKVVGIYKDAGFTGSNINRPEMTRLIADVQLNKIDTVLVYKLDRLSRSQKDTLYLIEDVFLKNGLNFVSLSENFDTDSPFGKAMIGMLAVFAQLEREQITERMKMGKLGRAKSGKTMSWGFKTFGYDLVGSELVINQLEASIVRKAFDLYASGVATTRLYRLLNEEGHIGKEKPWSYRTIRNVLENPVYAGFVRYNNHIFEGTHEPIISKEIYDKVQSMIKERYQNCYNQTPFKSKYLTTKLVKCGTCGCNLASAYYVRRKGESERRRVMYCLSQKKSRHTLKAPSEPCDLKRFNGKDLDASIIQEINKLRQSTPTVHLANLNIDFNKMTDQLNATNDKLDRLTNVYIEGKLSHQLYQEKYNTLIKQKNELTDLINKQSKNDIQEFKKLKETLENLPDEFGDLEQDVQRSILFTLLERIELYNDKLVFKWKFQR